LVFKYNLIKNNANEIPIQKFCTGQCDRTVAGGKPLKNQRKLTYSYVNDFSGTSSFSIEMAIRYSREVTLENDFILIWWEKK